MGRWTLAAIAVLLLVGVAARQDTPRLAFVSSQQILQQTPGYAQAESTYVAEMQSWSSEIQQLAQRLDSAWTAFDRQSVVLSPSDRQDKQEELRQMSQRLNQRRQEVSVRADEREQELMAPFQQRIQRVIEGLRAERNLLMIFDASAPGSNLISADPQLDLTAIVIQRLNSGAPTQNQ